MPTNGQYVVGELVTSADANTVFSRGNRNAIINGDYFINQRSFTTLSGSINTYGFDRWKVFSTGGATWSTQAFTTGNAIPGYEPANFSRIVTSGQSGASVASILAQPVEDVRTFAGQTTTLSFWAKAASGTPKIAVEVAQSFGTGGSPSALVETYAGQVTLSTTWTRYTVQIAVPSIAGKTLGTTANTSSVAIQLWVSAGTTYNARTGSLGIQSNTFDIWGVQWETGQIATPFQIPDRADELLRAQRFFLGQLPILTVTHTFAVLTKEGFPVQMRVSPVITTTFAGGATAGVITYPTARNLRYGWNGAGINPTDYVYTADAEL